MSKISKRFHVMVAGTWSYGIGVDGQLPWSLPDELHYFRDVTMKARPGKMNVVIMGRKTWESIPQRFRPLQDRWNIIVSRTMDDDEIYSRYSNVILVRSLNEAIDIVSDPPMFDVDQVFVIGGAQLYKEAVEHPACSHVHYTLVDVSVKCDTMFPLTFKERFAIDSVVAKRGKKDGIRMWFCVYRNNNLDRDRSNDEMPLGVHVMNPVLQTTWLDILKDYRMLHDIYMSLDKAAENIGEKDSGYSYSESRKALIRYEICHNLFYL